MTFVGEWYCYYHFLRKYSGKTTKQWEIACFGPPEPLQSVGVGPRIFT
jgi:hypothetical protein